MKFIMSLAMPVAINCHTKASIDAESNKNWPQFSDQTAPSELAAGTVANSKYWTDATTEYLAFRSQSIVFLGQSITDQCAFAAGGLPFWNSGQVDASMPSKAIMEGTASAFVKTGGSTKPCVGGIFWGACSNVVAEGTETCYNNLKKNLDGNNAKIRIDKRIAVYHDNTVTETKTGSGLVDETVTTTEGVKLFATNQDFLMASFWQKSVGKKLDGSTDIADPWCSAFLNKLTKAGSATLEATKDTGSSKKCTWQIRTSDATEGMAFKMKKDGQFIKAAIQYIEFLDASDFGASLPTMPTATGDQEATYYTGFKADDGGVYLNPLVNKLVVHKVVTNKIDNAWIYQTVEETTGSFRPGSIGFLSQFNENGAQGIFDSGDHLSIAGQLKKTVDTYNGLVTAHNTNVGAYNALATAWNDDNSKDLREVLRALPKTMVGSMTVPTGPKLDLKIAGDFASNNAYKTTKLEMGTATYTQVAAYKNPEFMFGKIDTPATWKFSQKDGKHSAHTAWLRNQGTTKYFETIGHSFGRMGQMDELDTKPYQYIEDTPSKTPTMILSFFPDGAQTAFTAGQKVEFDVKANTWLTNDDVNYPSSVSAPTALIECFAKSIAATIIASATIASTLY